MTKLCLTPLPKRLARYRTAHAGCQRLAGHEGLHAVPAEDPALWARGYGCPWDNEELELDTHPDGCTCHGCRYSIRTPR